MADETTKFLADTDSKNPGEFSSTARTSVTRLRSGPVGRKNRA